MISQKVADKLNQLLNQDFEITHIDTYRIDLLKIVGNSDLEIGVHLDNGHVETLFEDDGTMIDHGKYDNLFSGLSL